MVSENDIIYTLCLTGQGGHTVFRPNLVKLVLRLLSLIHILICCSLNVIFFAIIMFKEISLDQSPY